MKRAALPLALALAGCQHYASAPLAVVPPLASSPAQLAGADTNGPLDLDAVVRLALLNNPDLKAARAKRGLATAGLIQAGILPNPSLSAAFLPLVSGVGVAPAWSVGLTQDLKSLITYSSKRRAAKDVSGQAAADLLWQEWQVAGQARQLAVDLIGARAQRPVADRLYTIIAARNAAAQKALASGDLTLVTAAPTVAALQAARTNRDAVDQRLLDLQHRLDALLGLSPDIVLDLVPQPVLPLFDPATIQAGLATLPSRRPDLLALRLGYAAQEEAMRQAILSQFPDLILGGSTTSDSSRVVNVGPEGSIGLPIFDRGQGTIAIARATREQLAAEYAARLATAAGEVGAQLAEMDQLRQQLAIAERDLPAARLAADRATAARGQSAIEEFAFIDLINTRFTKEQEVMTLRLSLLDRQIALQTLLGAGLPQVDVLPMTLPVGARP
ncbi:TolC family protein [Sphingomonas nostoxanthinifaciens]|uniref:TolC family protein n=1 Tax=Sphingomonas nostoxanthinifaciens TaxID=2872652 RepID=UPI001CC1F201|nr:TolC family protein [Sphingomonas nostoxanthinifaciens]UAK25923.1 TolC family protein [Sphingomonas nostoxanthinifaciens]